MRPAGPSGAAPTALTLVRPIAIRAGASTYAVAARQAARGNDVRFQVSITARPPATARAQRRHRGAIGIQGRVIAGPAGAPTSVEIPLRIAVVQTGVGEKVIATKVYRTSVAMTEDGSVPFSFVATIWCITAPPRTTGNFVFYIGFDPQALAPRAQGKISRRK